MTAPSLDVVVARYRERVEWTRNVPAAVRVTIYDKGHDLDPASVPRAHVVVATNIGNEADTYIRHIIARYDSLADVTVFCQGHPFDHASDLHKVIRAIASEQLHVPAFHWLGFIIDTDDSRGRRLFVPWSKNHDGRELRLDDFHQRLLHAPAPEAISFYCGGQFAASAATIRSRPLAFWQRALDLAHTFPDAAHCFERLWDRVFDLEGVDPALLDGKPCRYLKPIRRLADDSDGT